jgi:hypothetical protein
MLKSKNRGAEVRTRGGGADAHFFDLTSSDRGRSPLSGRLPVFFGGRIVAQDDAADRQQEAEIVGRQFFPVLPYPFRYVLSSIFEKYPHIICKTVRQKYSLHI